MLPTFDFVNVARAAIRVAGRAVLSRVGVAALASVACVAFCTNILAAYKIDFVYEHLSIQVPSGVSESPVFSLLMYCTSADVLISAWNKFLNFLDGFANAFVLAIIAFLTFNFTSYIYSCFREDLNDLA